MKNWCIYHPKDNEVIEYLRKLKCKYNLRFECNLAYYYYLDDNNELNSLYSLPTGYTLLTEQDFKEQIMNKKELPQYFLVRKDDSTSLWDKYIKWLNNKYDENWGGKTYDYYGFVGDIGYNGTAGTNYPNNWMNNPTLLTLEEWDSIVNQEQFILPEKWYVKYSKEAHDWIKQNAEMNGNNIPKSKYYYYPCDTFKNNYSGYIPGGYTEITFNQFKQYVLKENMGSKEEIIGYKAPYDLFGGKIKQGDLYKFKDTGYVHYLSDAYYLPKEIVETWEPVYKAKEQTYTLSNGKEVKITKEYVICSGENVTIQAFKELMKYSHVTDGNPFYKWTVQITGITFKIGCWEDVKLSDIQQIIKIHEKL